MPSPAPLIGRPSHASVGTNPSARGAAAAGTKFAAPPGYDAFVVPECIVCFLHPEPRKKLLEWRKWTNVGNKQASPLGPAAKITEAADLGHAARLLQDDTQRKILLLDGFEPY